MLVGVRRLELLKFFRDKFDDIRRHCILRSGSGGVSSDKPRGKRAVHSVAVGECLHEPGGIDQVGADKGSRRFQRELLVKGESKGLALLNNAAVCHAVLGYPALSAHELMEAVAGWVESGGASLNKATKFQVVDGNF